jgi:low temperature requirement protein LtrA
LHWPRSRERSEAAGRVGFIELFFDLVFVFAITQFSHLLLEHLTWSAAAETAFVLVAVWWTWITVLWWTTGSAPRAASCGSSWSPRWWRAC